MKYFQVISTAFRWPCLLLIMLPSSMLAQGLDYAGFISQLSGVHPNLKKQALNTELAIQETAVQEANQAWELGIGAQQAHQEELLPAFGPETIDQRSLNMSIARPIWKTGASISVMAEATDADNEYGAGASPGFPTPDQTETQQLSVTFSQPLMKNRGGVQSSLAYDLSLDAQKITQMNALEAQESFLLSMSHEYLDWVSSYEQVRIYEKRTLLAKQQVNEISKRYQKNLVEKVDLLRSQDSLRMSEQNLLLSQSQFRAKRLSLARLSQVEQVISQNPDFSLYTIPELPDLNILLNRLNSDARQLQALKYQAQQLQRRYKGIENSQLPELNLDLRAAIKEEDQSGLAANTQSSDDGNDYSVGLNFRKMLGNHSAKNQKQKLKVEIEQAELEQQYAWMQLASQIENVYVQLEELQNILKLNQQLLFTAEQTTEEEQKIYQQGRSELTNVISSRDQVQNVRLQYAQNALNYHRLYFQLLALSDQLLPAGQQ